MLVTFGARRRDPDGVDLLIECHGRIRRHLVMARRLAEATGHPAKDIRETAAQVRRYFTEALPLHMQDEEENVLELLAGRSSAVDDALARMAADHLDHEPKVERLVALCGELEHDPGRLDALAVDLRIVVTFLEPAFLAHLELEERTLFSALRTLPQRHRDALAAAMRARREAVLAGSL